MIGGGPRGRNVISTEGNARALHFSPAPTGLRSGQFSHHSSDAGLFWASPYFYILDIHQLVLKKIAALVESTRDRAAAAVKSGSTVFSVQQQQRAVSLAEEFCIQKHAIKLALKPQQK